MDRPDRWLPGVDHAADRPLPRIEEEQHRRLHVDDARVSEAHALVSLRGRELQLLALRGRFAVDSTPRSHSRRACESNSRGASLSRS